MDLKIVSPAFGEKVLLQQCDMINNTSRIEKEKYAKFNLTDDRLDKFYFHILTDLHPELKKLIKLILSLNHDKQAQNEGSMLIN